MHLGMIIDDERLKHEQEILNRLAIGLVDEGVAVTRFVPDAQMPESVEAADQEVSQVTTAIEVPLRVAPWMHSVRTRKIVSALEKAVPDLLLAVGHRAWPVGMELGAALKCPVVLDVWSMERAKTAPRGRAAGAVAAYVARTEPLAEHLRTRVDANLVTVVRPGVVIPDVARSILAFADQSISMAVIGGGRDVTSYTAMMVGLSQIIREMPQIQVAIELRGPHAHVIWQEARRLELLSHLSAITDAAPLRTLLTRCDLLLMPERYGQVRSLTLEAMANGMAVIGADDPALDMCIDGETVAVVSEADPEQWARQIRRLLNDPDHARRLGAAARVRMETHHRSSDQIHHWLTLLERVLTGGAYPFAEPSRVD